MGRLVTDRCLCCRWWWWFFLWCLCRDDASDVVSTLLLKSCERSPVVSPTFILVSVASVASGFGELPPPLDDLRTVACWTGTLVATAAATTAFDVLDTFAVPLIRP